MGIVICHFSHHMPVSVVLSLCSALIILWSGMTMVSF